MIQKQIQNLKNKVSKYQEVLSEMEDLTVRIEKIRRVTAGEKELHLEGIEYSCNSCGENYEPVPHPKPGRNGLCSPCYRGITIGEKVEVEPNPYPETARVIGQPVSRGGFLKKAFPNGFSKSDRIRIRELEDFRWGAGDLRNVKS